MAAAQRKGQKVNVLEACLCNVSVIFLAGFLLGFGLTVLVFLPHKAPGLLANHAPAAQRSDPQHIHDYWIKLKARLRSIKSIASNLTIARDIREGLLDMQGGILKRRMRILCWVMTVKSTDNKLKALTVKRTWGRRCDKILFFAEAADAEVPMIKINKVQKGRRGLWTKVVGAFKYIHKHHRDEYDWVLRADDDTYAIIENIREMLLPYSPYEPGYFGSKFQTHSPKGYFSGGGGVLLSKEALDRVVEGAFDNKHKDCKNITYSAADDDVKIGQCLYAVGVEPDDSRDYKGRSRMHCFDVESHLKPDLGDRNWWYWSYLHWNIKGGLECCGENGIAWHYIPPKQQYAIQYLAYTVRVENVVAVSRATGGFPKIVTTTTYTPQHAKREG